MATLALTAVPQAVTLEPGTPLYFTNTNGSAANVSYGFTSAGCLASPVPVLSLAATTGTAFWAWPGIFISFGTAQLYVVASVSSGVTMYYPA